MINFLRRVKRKIKALLIYIKWLFEDKSAYWGERETGIPLEDMDAVMETFYPDILEYFSTEEGKKEFAEWKAKKDAKEKVDKAKRGG